MAEPERSDRFPDGIPFIVGNEGAERFSYYGMRAILWTYLASLYVHFIHESLLSKTELAAAKSKSTAIAHLFMAGVYAFPMIGAILADRLLGKYPVIFWVSLIYCLGHGVLAVAGHMAVTGHYGAAETGMYVGLALIAVGAGGIKPCVSSNVGDQFTAKTSHLVPKVFQAFYFIINFGSFFSTIITPLLKDKVSAEVAFGVPAIFMAVATFIFFLGRKRFVHVKPNPGGLLGLLDVGSAMLFFSPVIAIIVAVFVQGDHYKPPDPTAMSKGDFYLSYLRGYTGHLATSSWHYFVIAAVLVLAGFALFRERQRRSQDDGFLAVLVYALQNRTKRKAGAGFFDTAREKFGEEAAEGPPAVFRLVILFSAISVFWALFDQHASTWVQQAKEMNRSISVPMWTARFTFGATIAAALYGGTWLVLWVSNRTMPRMVRSVALAALALSGTSAVIGDLVLRKMLVIEASAAQMQALNPLMVMIIIPSLNVFLYRPFERRGKPLAPLMRMRMGMFLAAAAFGVATVLQTKMEAAAASGLKVHVMWQVAQYLVMTTSEVLVSTTGLEFAYTQAPRRMKSTIMGFWLLAVTFGNVLVAFLAPMQKILSLSQFFLVFTCLMVGASLVFSVLSAFHKGKARLQLERA